MDAADSPAAILNGHFHDNLIQQLFDSGQAMHHAPAPITAEPENSPLPRTTADLHDMIDSIREGAVQEPRDHGLDELSGR